MAQDRMEIFAFRKKFRDLAIASIPNTFFSDCNFLQEEKPRWTDLSGRIHPGGSSRPLRTAIHLDKPMDRSIPADFSRPISPDGPIGTDLSGWVCPDRSVMMGPSGWVCADRFFQTDPSGGIHGPSGQVRPEIRLDGSIQTDLSRQTHPNRSVKTDPSRWIHPDRSVGTYSFLIRGRN